ncbi:MAG: hypothetical protein WBG44_09365 [Comamonas sp.]
MQPWERRLRDLAQLLSNCGETYFLPDRFRQNINQFLQTSRTVTFIIQKNKGRIPEFDSWYKGAVLQPWQADPVMSWAKDARNVIEKEGDLEMYSTLQVAVLYSYESDEDMIIEVTRKELLQASIEQLLKIARNKLPPEILVSAVLKTQRKWVANTLPGRELIQALTYVYSQLYEVCSGLAAHLESELDSSVPYPTNFDPNSNDIARVRFMKLRQPGVGQNKSVRFKADPNFKAPPALQKLKNDFDAMPKPASLADVVSRHAKMAQATFEQYANHIPMLALYDKNWRHIDFLSTAFSDQSEKYLFWRNAADRAFYLKAYAMVWTSELWIRDLKDGNNRPISELPIIGEQLHVVAVDASGATEVVAWSITRTTENEKPSLIQLGPEEAFRKPEHIFFVKPVVAAMKLAHTGSAIKSGN